MIKNCFPLSGKNTSFVIDHLKSFNPEKIRANWSHMMAEHSPFATLNKRSFPNRYLLENALGKFSKRSNDGQELENLNLGPSYMDNFLSLFLYQHM